MLAGAQSDRAVGRRGDDLCLGQIAIFKWGIAEIKSVDPLALPLTAEERPGKLGAHLARLLDRADRHDFLRSMSERGNHRGSCPEHIENDAGRLRKIAAREPDDLCRAEGDINIHSGRSRLPARRAW